MHALRLLATAAVAFALGPRQDDKIIPGRYIISLNQDTEPPSVDSHVTWVKDLHLRSLTRRDEKGINKVWKGNFKGYSGEFDEGTLDEIRQSDDVSQAKPSQAQT
jgi:oryzin